MPDRKTKLTKVAIEAVPLPPAGQVTVWDTQLPGFGLRVGAGGAKTFFLMRRINGKAVKRTIGRFGVLTAEQARKDAIAMAAEMTRGVDSVAERRKAAARQVTLEQAVTAYLHDRPLKPRTVKDVQVKMKFFTDWSALPITEIRPAMIEDRYSGLIEGKPTGASIKLAMRYLRAVLNYANAKFSDDSGDPILPRGNPVKRLSVTRKGWTAGARRRSFIKPSEIKAWVEAVLSLKGLYRAIEVRDCLMLGLLTGVRPSEALGLRWPDVDFANTTITFANTKNGVDHELPLTRWLAGTLAARREMSGPVLVFSDAAGTPLKDRDIRAAIDQIAEVSDIRFMPSDLRRTFITAAERLDIGIYSLKRMLNHTIGGDVTSGYIIPTTDRLREPMQRVEDCMLGLAGLLPSAEIIELHAEQW